MLLCCAGYFTSRPASKAYIRSATAYLQAARQLEAFMGLPAGSSDGMSGADLHIRHCLIADVIVLAGSHVHALIYKSVCCVLRRSYH